jgi:hypothetical protein
MTFPLLPQTFTGTVIGTVTLLPEAAPGELLEVPVAVPPIPLPEVHVFPAVVLPAPTPVTPLPQTFTGTVIGSVMLLPAPTPPELDDRPDPLVPEPTPPEEQAAPIALLAAPTPVTVLPQTFTGTSIGTVTLLPASTPGELLLFPVDDADGPPDDDPPPDGLEVGVPHESRIAELAAPTTLTVLPDTHTGALTGTETLLPDRTPGEPVDD